MKRAIRLIPAVVVLVAASSAQAVTLRYRGKPGEVRNYSFAMAMRMRSDAMGMQMRMETASTASLAQKVQSVDDGVLAIEQKVTKGKSITKMEGVDEPVEQELPEMTVLIKMDAQGRVKQFKGDEGSMMMDPSQALARVLTEMGMFPDRDLKVGDTWSNHREIADSGIGAVKIRYTRKLAALESRDKRDCAKIETKFNGSIEATPEMMGEEDLPGGGFDATIAFAGTAVTWFDHAAGVTVAEDSTAKVVMEMHFTMPAMGAGEDVEHSSKTAMIMNTKIALRK